MYTLRQKLHTQGVHSRVPLRPEYWSEKEKQLLVIRGCGRFLGLTNMPIQDAYDSLLDLNRWIAEEKNPRVPKKKREFHPRPSTFEERLEAVRRCVDLGEDVNLVAKEIKRHPSNIHTWCRRYEQEGYIALMKKEKKKQPTKAVNEIDNIEELKAQMLELQLENDILRETINVLKKDPGINQAALKNREKAVIVDALKDKYSLPLLLEKLQFSKSSYYYQ